MEPDEQSLEELIDDNQQRLADTTMKAIHSLLAAHNRSLETVHNRQLIVEVAAAVSAAVQSELVDLVAEAGAAG